MVGLAVFATPGVSAVPSDVWPITALAGETDATTAPRILPRPVLPPEGPLSVPLPTTSSVAMTVPLRPAGGKSAIFSTAFLQVLWQRLRVPLFLFVLGVVFLAFLVLSLRSKRPSRLRSLTARSLVLSLIIHLVLLLSFNSFVLSQRIIRTIRDPQFEVLLDSNSLVEEKVSLGIREETSQLPLADSALVVAPQQAAVPLPKATPAEQAPTVVPGRIDLSPFDVPANVVEPKPVEQKAPTIPLAARPSGDFRVALPDVALETPRLPATPEPVRETSPAATLAPQKTGQPVAFVPPAASQPSTRVAAAEIPPLGPGAPLTASVIALPAPAGVHAGRPIEPVIPPRVLVPRPSPKLVPPPFVLEERPAVEEPYQLRQPERRAKVLESLGGAPETEEAVRRALSWLAAHQSDDGRWDIANFDAKCGKCGGKGEYGKQNVAATALAVLAFLGAGQSHKTAGPHQEAIARAIAWLVAQARESGDLRGQGNMYDQGMATIALAEACGMTHDPSLRLPVTRAAKFIAGAQNRETGGWRYFPGEEGDTSVFGWHLMALKSASMAGLPVSQEAIKRAEGWLDRVGGGEHGGLYGYQSQKPSPAMVAEGMFSRQLLGRLPTDPSMIESAEYLLKYLPEAGDPNMYYWYYGTLAMFQHQGPSWEQWNRAMRKVLLSRQEASGAAKGSWPPGGQWGKQGGRVIETAMAALCLEVYYRYLPLYAPHAPTVASKSKP